MLETNVRHSDVAAHFGISRLTITSLTRRYRAAGMVIDRPLSGRTRVTTRRQDIHIRMSHLQDHFLTATSNAMPTRGRNSDRISAHIVRSRLAEQGIKARCPYYGIQLTQRHRRAREQWVRQHVRWNQKHWNTVLFSDESRFRLSHSHGCHWVYRRRNERFRDVYVR